MLRRAFSLLLVGALGSLGAHAQTPPLPALITEAAIGDQSVRLATTGAGAVGDDNEASIAGTVEGAFRGRVAAAVRITAQTGADTPTLGGELRVGLLGENAPVDLAVGGRYTREGFVPGTDEAEGFVAFGADLGEWRLLVNGVGGHALTADEGDVEAGLTATRRLGDRVRLGAGIKGRQRFGDEPAWEEEEDAEAERDGDAIVGGIFGYDVGNVSAVGLVGGRSTFGHEDVAIGGYAQVGAQVAF
jgi:hypothetical protein